MRLVPSSARESAFPLVLLLGRGSRRAVIAPRSVAADVRRRTRVQPSAYPALVSSSARSRAFTLIELMVVMILMGIMAAMVLPEMKGSYEDALLRSASRELVDGFDVAYSQAVSLNQTHRVRLDRQRSRYVLERKLSEDAQRDEFVPVRDIPGGAGNLDPRIQIQFRKTGEGAESEAGPEPLPAGAEDSRRQETPRSGNDSEGVSFYPDGTADAVEVVLQDRDGFRLGLQINPATARVHIVELGRK